MKRLWRGMAAYLFPGGLFAGAGLKRFLTFLADLVDDLRPALAGGTSAACTHSHIPPSRVDLCPERDNHSRPT